LDRGDFAGRDGDVELAVDVIGRIEDVTVFEEEIVVGGLRGDGENGEKSDDAKTKSGQKSAVHAESFGNANGARSVYAGGLENKNWKMEIRGRSLRVGLGNMFARQRDNMIERQIFEG
jgi:hypothetical protein